MIRWEPLFCIPDIKDIERRVLPMEFGVQSKREIKNQNKLDYSD